MPQPVIQNNSKIRELLLLGNPLDILVAEGGKRGWTRADVLRVASENGWKLDPSGRVPLTDRARAQGHPVVGRPAAPPQPPLAVVPPPAPQPAAGALQVVGVTQPRLWTVLVTGQDHPVAAIKKKAQRILEQLTQLATDVDAAEEKQRARERVEKLEADLAAAKAALRKDGASGAEAPAKGEARQIRAWAKDNGIDVPPRGRVPSAVVAQWREASRG